MFTETSVPVTEKMAGDTAIINVQQIIGDSSINFCHENKYRIKILGV